MKPFPCSSTDSVMPPRLLCKSAQPAVLRKVACTLTSRVWSLPRASSAGLTMPRSVRNKKLGSSRPCAILRVLPSAPILPPGAPGGPRTTTVRRNTYLRRVSRHYRSEEHTSELQSHLNIVCRLLLEKKKK